MASSTGIRIAGMNVHYIHRVDVRRSINSRGGTASFPLRNTSAR